MGAFIDFTYVKEHADFRKVLSHYGFPFTESDDQLRCQCPFTDHDDANPSFSANTAKNVWQCFGCNKRGNILELVEQIEDADDLREAATTLAEISGIALSPSQSPRKLGTKALGSRQSDVETPRAGKGAKGRRTSRKHPLASPERVSGGSGVNTPLSFQLKLDPEHPYLAERGVSAELIQHFGLGYCSKGSMAGLICIPIHNASGEVVGYAGRWPADPVPDGEDRYRMPKRFYKNQVLWNLHRLQTPDTVVIVEGFFGAMCLHALGVPVVSTMGTSISSSQVKLLLKSGVSRVVLCYDADAPGIAAMPAALAQLAPELFVHCFSLPDGASPDTASVEALQSLAELVNS
ncbi:MAG: CHC2 zinc finger domain-containing protein [Cognatishimia sp.]|uniref:CHC2 zinc finger domain-containing protein n=1 Tax=Cognatishimia sp. TaxID=2211648 RepID=UPI004059FED5